MKALAAVQDSANALLKFAYSGIRVRDLERSMKFYVDILGLKEVAKGKMKHGGIYALLEDATTKQRIELNYYPGGSEFYEEYSVGSGIDHLGFVVDNVSETYKELISKGATAATKPWKEVDEDDKSWIAFVKDPDGIWIELINK